MSKSTKPTVRAKPRKPKDCPLFPHASGRWAKKIRQRFVYFGPWNDLNGALEKWAAQKDDLLAGRVVRPQANGAISVRELVNRFLNSKRLLVESGELALVTWGDYKSVGETLVEVFGASRAVADLRPEDFEALRAHVARGKRGKGVGPVVVGNFITRSRVLFKYALDNDLIERPVRFGQGFKRPGKKTIRRLRNEQALRMFTRDELRRIIDKAEQPLKAMILLGANAGLGNSDLGQLPYSALDLDDGWLTYPRPKTHVTRKAALWPETIAAVREWLAMRPKPKSDADANLVFVTRCGASWHKGNSTAPDNPVCKEMRKLLAELGIVRPWLSFYGLRHGFETIAGQTRDQPAVDRVMGHAEHANDMSAVYREVGGDETMDDRLRAVAEHVRKWLFGAEVKPADNTQNVAAIGFDDVSNTLAEALAKSNLRYAADAKSKFVKGRGKTK